MFAEDVVPKKELEAGCIYRRAIAIPFGVCIWVIDRNIHWHIHLCGVEERNIKKVAGLEFRRGDK